MKPHIMKLPGVKSGDTGGQRAAKHGQYVIQAHISSPALIYEDIYIYIYILYLQFESAIRIYIL
jgi:hypothetical protein